jgi:DnaJ-domain-containing protein 1
LEQAVSALQGYVNYEMIMAGPTMARQALHATAASVRPNPANPLASPLGLWPKTPGSAEADGLLGPFSRASYAFRERLAARMSAGEGSISPRRLQLYHQVYGFDFTWGSNASNGGSARARTAEDREGSGVPGRFTSAKDYYSVLMVSPEASDAQIKSARNKLARKYHPDLNPGDRAAAKRMREINEAYDVLGDPVLRRRYDDARRANAS